MGNLTALLETLPSDPHPRGIAFERLAKWFLENDPVYRSQVKKVWFWRDWPGRDGVDIGIDLVVEANDGGIWAVQAKGYSETRRISKADVNKWLAASSRHPFTYRLLVASTDLIGRNAVRSIHDQRTPVGMLLLSDLLDSAVVWPASLKLLTPAKRQRRTPRPHQRRACRDVVRGFEKTDRAQLVMACGTGKTLVALWIAEALKAKRVLVLVPSLSLLAQVIREWVSTARGDMPYLAVCSDATVVRRDDIVGSISELPYPVTTDPSAVAAFLRKRRSSPSVVFATYQSSRSIASAMAEPVPEFDLVVADEAHRLTGVGDRAFTLVLKDDAVRAKKRLFMTATPSYFRGRRRNGQRVEDQDVVSMADTNEFGPVLHKLSFAEAIARGLLADYVVAIMGVDDRAVAAAISERRVVIAEGLPERVDARALAAQIGLAKALNRFKLRRTLTFHNRIEAARAFAVEFPLVTEWLPVPDRPSGSLWADYVAGHMQAGDRAARIRRLAAPDSDFAILANARCLAEGVDIPALEAVAFVDPRESAVDIIQAVGRVIRPSDGKQRGVVVLPVFVGSPSDPESVLRDSDFAPVWAVLRALRAHDPDFGEALDRGRRDVGARKRALRLPDKIVLDMPEWVDIEFGRAIQVRLLASTTSSWEYMYGVLEEHAERTGTSVFPQKTMGGEDGTLPLGHWVNQQRTSRESLSPERRALLEALPHWTWNAREGLWDSRFKLLEAYVCEWGHARVPSDAVIDGVPLGRWVVEQRVAMESMSERRRRLLGALPGWTWNVREDSWMSRYTVLLLYVEEHGTSLVPRSEDRGVNLGTWIHNQRSKRSKLSADRQRLLEALPNWTWDTKEAAWERKFRLLLDFVSSEGHAFVPQNYKVGDESLGNWVNQQRVLRYSMSAERRVRLEAVEGWEWDPRQAKWLTMYRLIQSFAAREGHVRVSAQWQEDCEPIGKLFNWCGTQRALYRKGRLATDRIQLLEQVGGWKW